MTQQYFRQLLEKLKKEDKDVDVRAVAADILSKHYKQ